MIRSTSIRAALLAAAAFLAVLPAAAQRVPTETAIFAGGCFWCTEVDFDKVDGVIATTSGYIGGKTDNPTYRDVTSGRSGHTEAVLVEYDPQKVTYKQLVEIFWRTIDPLDGDGQFCDRGSSYRPGIFTQNAAQTKIAEASKQALIDSKRFKQPILAEVTQDQKFWKAEAYHQDFYKKDPGRYYSYRAGCGRDARIKALWGAEAGGKIATQ
jgi:peptide-methionine (S)-S-oxide reductase